jgi:hypothetical protein
MHVLLIPDAKRITDHTIISAMGQEALIFLATNKSRTNAKLVFFVYNDPDRINQISFYLIEIFYLL